MRTKKFNIDGRENERQYNKGDYVGGRNGVVTDQLGVTYEQVRNVYAALYGYSNYNGNDETYEEGVEKWWKQILSNARRQNQSYNNNLPSRKIRRRKIRIEFDLETGGLDPHLINPYWLNC